LNKGASERAHGQSPPFSWRSHLPPEEAYSIVLVQEGRCVREQR
jgi:hypothetical protein